MAMNPMQRRARNSFFIGFLLALVIMAVVVMLLVNQIKGVNEELNALKGLQKTALVAASDLKSGSEITMESLKNDTVQTSLDRGKMVMASDFEEVDEQTGETHAKSIIVRTDIPAGTIITTDLLEEVEEKTTNDLRMQEYNMIILPTLLVNGDFVDIRLQLPTGEDYIVVSKKKVEHTDATTIWMKMREDEILTLNNAIVEAYTMLGSKLYATVYTQAGIQEAAVATYPVSKEVGELIENDPNIVDNARNALWSRYNADQRNDHINSVLGGFVETMNESVEAGLQEEITKIQQARQTYVDSLQGTGEVGTDN